MAASASPATPDAEADWAAPYDVDLALVLGPFLRGRSDPSMILTGATEAWCASRTPAGAGTVNVAVDGRTVRARAWGPGAQWLVATVPGLLGARDDPTGFPADLLPDRLQATWRRLARRWRVPASGRVLESLVIAILEQKVTGVQSRRAWQALLREAGERAPGPTPRDLRVLPEATALRRVPSWHWHRWGVGPHQSATIVRAARVAGRVEECGTVPMDDARRRLGAITGVGEWTVAEVSQRALGDPDAVSFGDFHLAHHVVFAFTGSMDGTDDDMRALLAPFAGHRYRVQRIVEASGISRPARGPRMTIADHRRI